MSKGAWHALGRFDASCGRAWSVGVSYSPRIRRQWLAGWIERVVSLHANGTKDLPVFHAKRSTAGEGWSAVELDLLSAGCRAIPRAPFPLLADILGRSPDSARSKASRSGFVRST